MSLLPKIRSIAFTLLEMLVVIAIIGIMAVLVLPSVSNITRGTKTSQAVESVAGYIDQARLLAGAQGVPVQIRFYQNPDIDETNYHAVQLYLEGETVQPASALITLPDSIVIAGDARSSLLAEAEADTGGTDEGTSAGWDYLKMQVRPSGETTLPMNTLMALAIGSKRVIDESGPTDVTPELLAVVVDPFTGRARIVGR